MQTRVFSKQPCCTASLPALRIEIFSYKWSSPHPLATALYDARLTFKYDGMKVARFPVYCLSMRFPAPKVDSPPSQHISIFRIFQSLHMTVTNVDGLGVNMASQR
jgi:hypothetical protein